MENNENNQNNEQKTNLNTEPASTYVAVNSHKEKAKVGFSKGVLLPFLCGALGTSIVIGTCFGVPKKMKIISKKIFKIIKYQILLVSHFQITQRQVLMLQTKFFHQLLE